MQFLRTVSIAGLFLLFGYASTAQTDKLYHLNPEKVKVVGPTGAQDMAWGGGFNNPQFGMADLNRDGKKDLVVYEPEGRIRTFINIGTPGTVKFRYDPRFEANFPPVEFFFKLVDYNNDTLPDFWTGTSKLKRYKAYYNQANELAFGNPDFITYTLKGQTNSIPLNTFNMPDIADVDEDGNVDIVTFTYLTNSRVYYFRNMRDNTMPKDVVNYKWLDKCWGKFQQSELRREHQLGIECNADNALLDLRVAPGYKTTGGAHAICLFDADGDGDMDVLDGMGTLSEVQFLKNGKKEYNYPKDTMILQDTMWQTGGKQLQLSNFPLGFWIDIDDDNDKDLLFSPFAAGENYKCVHYYKNTGSDAAPNFQFQTDTLFMDNMIDVGELAYPALYDYNKDGKPDLFIGNRGYYQPGGNPKRSKISYYSNTSTPGDASLKLETTDFMNISGQVLSGAAPAFGDLNADGKDDMVLGKADGTLLFFENIAATNTDIPNWALKLGNIQAGGKDINVGGSAMPVIYDFDKDGDNDLIVGNSFAYLAYYENLGKDASGYPKLQYITDKLGGVHVPEQQFSTNGNSCPFIGKIDNTGTEYLLVGNSKGVIYHYSFIPGNTTAPFQLLDSSYSDIQGFGVAAPVVGDLDGNGKYEMILGTKYGGLLLYEQLFDVNINDLDKSKDKISLYPNPAQGEMMLSVQGKKLNADVVVKIFDRLGRTLMVQQVKLNDYNIRLDISSLPQGVYMCTLLNNGESSSASFIKK